MYVKKVVCFLNDWYKHNASRYAWTIGCMVVHCVWMQCIRELHTEAEATTTTTIPTSKFKYNNNIQKWRLMFVISALCMSHTPTGGDDISTKPSYYALILIWKGCIGVLAHWIRMKQFFISIKFDICSYWIYSKVQLFGQLQFALQYVRL